MEDLVFHTVTDSGQAVPALLCPALRAWAAYRLAWTAALREPVGMLHVSLCCTGECYDRWQLNLSGDSRWFCLLHKLKGARAWEKEKNLLMHGICTAWCRKIHPWSLLHERRVVSIQGMKDLLSVYSPLYSLLLNQLFCYAVCYWTFFTEIQNKLCTSLPLLSPTLLPRAEHPNSPSSDSYTLPVLHSCNCMAIILSILIFIYSY